MSKDSISKRSPLIERVRLDAIRLAPYNPNRMSARQLDGLSASMKRWGFLQSLVVNRRTGKEWPAGERGLLTMIAGAHRHAAALRNGESEADAYFVDVSPAEEKALNLALNNHGAPDAVSLGAVLQSLASASVDLGPTGMETRQIDCALAAFLASQDLNGDNGDDTIEPPAHPVTKRGEVIELGPHRLICADALEPRNVDAADAFATILGAATRAAAMVTDPPYAIYGSSSGLSSSVTDDKIVRPFFRGVLGLAQSSIRLFGHVYIFCDWRSWPSWWEMAKGSQLEPKNLLVWDKGGSGMGNNWANTHELIGYFAVMPIQRTMSSARKTGQRAVLQSNVIRCKRPTGAERQHNAAKPVDLLSTLITAATDVGDAVLDPFAGSGSTLVAAHRTHRRALLVEIEPSWCDVIRERWERMRELPEK